MDEKKQGQSEYSNDRTETTALGAAPQPSSVAESSTTASIGPSSSYTPETQPARAYSPLADFTAYLKRTRRWWLIAAGAICGLVAVVTAAKDVNEWARKAREQRHEEAVASVTPDSVIARCGPPAEDTTNDVYPVLMRTISYQPKDSEKVVLAFSRTAEEKSDWVFLSLKGNLQTGNYDTTEAKIAALPCLDSKK